MNTIERYEVKAEAFTIMTGTMAPGKDVAPGAYSLPYEERAVKYDNWYRDNEKCIRAMMMAFDRVM